MWALYTTAQLCGYPAISSMLRFSVLLQVEELFAVDRDGESEEFKDLGNRQLLWHGSRMTNWMGILSQGLRIAPPEAPMTGYMVCESKEIKKRLEDYSTSVA